MSRSQAACVGAWLEERRRSFGFAFQGARRLLREPNARIHAAATIVVISAGLVAHLSASEWCWILVSVCAVWVTEALNTALELLCDAAVPVHHPLIGAAKDVAAFAVLISAIGAVVIAGIVFVPYLERLLT